MNPRDYLDVAFDLVGEYREADWRCAIHCAYYAAFHVAQEFMELCGFYVTQREQAHGHAWIRLVNSGEPRLVKTGTVLRRLRQDRNRAEYVLSQPILQALAVDRVRQAETIINDLDRFAQSPGTLAQITPLMRAFERDVLGDVTWQRPTP